MKCKYKFQISGRVRLHAATPIDVGGWTYEFVVKNEMATHLDVTVPLADQSQWPIVTPNPEPGVQLHVNVNTVHFPFIKRDLRVLQGLISVFQTITISYEDPLIEWIPENAEERAALPMFSFSTKSEPLPDDKLHDLPFDLLARSVIATRRASAVEVPLNFYRRGMLDLLNSAYIEAIYDFFFVIENLYSNGKFRKASMIAEFKSSSTLCNLVEKAVREPSMIVQQKRSTYERYVSKYGKLTVEQAIEEMVSLRGRLHHHTSKSPARWHPEQQDEFEVNALFMQATSFGVIFELIRPHIWHPDVIKKFLLIQPPQRVTDA